MCFPVSISLESLNSGLSWSRWIFRCPLIRTEVDERLVHPKGQKVKVWSSLAQRAVSSPWHQHTSNCWSEVCPAQSHTELDRTPWHCTKFCWRTKKIVSSWKIEPDCGHKPIVNHSPNQRWSTGNSFLGRGGTKNKSWTEASPWGLRTVKTISLSDWLITNK